MKAFSMVFLLFLITLQTSSAQNSNYFQKNYNWNRTDYFTDIYAKEDSTYLLLTTTVTFPDVWHTQSTIINNKGEVLNTNVYKYDTLHNANGMISQIDDGFILSPYIRNLDRTDIYGHYLMVDKSGNMLKSSRADTTSHYSFFLHFLPTSDEGYLVNGIYVDNPTLSWTPHFTKLNQNFEFESDTIFFDYEDSSYFTDFKAVPEEESYFYAYGTKAWHLGSGDLILAKIDEWGNRIWEKFFDLDELLEEESWPIAGEDLAGPMLLTQDGGFLLAGGASLSSGDKGFFLKLNAEFNVEWILFNYDYNGLAIRKMYELTDGSIVYSSSYKWDYYNSLIDSSRQDYDVQIGKIDKHGNYLWERKYGKIGVGYDEGLNGMAVTNNQRHGKDGFIMVGRANKEFGEADAFFIKTNCMGLLTEPFASFSAEQDSEHELTYHFTNYSEFVYPDSIDGGHFIWDFGDGTTSNELHPSHEYADKGLSYVVTLTAVVCSDTSRREVKVVAGDEVVGIEVLEEDLPAFSFKLYPNPAIGGEVVLEYDLPKEGVLELFDLQGKEVGRWSLETFNVGYSVFDIRYLNAGLYVYRLSVEGRTLENGKLVVE